MKGCQNCENNNELKPRCLRRIAVEIPEDTLWKLGDNGMTLKASCHLSAINHENNAMPVTKIETPVLSQFFYTVSSSKDMDPPPPPPENDRQSGEATPNQSAQKLPKGVVIGKDGKP